MHLCCWFARKMSQFTCFCGVKFLAWKSGCVKFLTNSMFAHMTYSTSTQLRMPAYIVLWSSVNDRLKLHLCSSNLQLLLAIVARLIFSMQTTRKEKLFTNLHCIDGPIQQSSHLWTLGVSKTCAEKAGFGPRSSPAMFANGRRFVAMDYAQQQRSTTTQPHHARASPADNVQGAMPPP